MSIPKEPRQLMINLMYLVLTAMLALNVSAEIINAFFMVDEGIQKSNEIVETSNEQLKTAIDKAIAAYPKYKAYGPKATKAQEITEDFVAYVKAIRNEIVDEAGGLDEHNHPVKKKDKDITTRILVDGGKGAELEAKIKETRIQLLELIDEKEREDFAAKLPLEASAIPESSDKTDWADYNFRQMPVAATLPMFSKWQNDAYTSETAILNYIAKKVDGTDRKFDSFEPVVSAEKQYVIKGEKYTAEIFLSASSKSSSKDTKISVNGSPISVKDGKGIYTAKTTSIGEKTFSVAIKLKNPVTGKVDTYKKEFKYEVGERSVNVSADKMNVFYIGVQNPITVAAGGIPSSKIKVTASGATLSPKGTLKWNATVKRPGKATITVSGGGLKPTKFEYRVKRIPDPVAKLSKSTGGTMNSGEFRAQGGVSAVLENFDFDAKCKIDGFNLVRVEKRQDPVEAANRGARYSGTASKLISAAKPGDIFYFDNIKARCPGDAAGRKINSMVFKIK